MYTSSQDRLKAVCVDSEGAQANRTIALPGNSKNFDRFLSNLQWELGAIGGSPSTVIPFQKAVSDVPLAAFGVWANLGEFV